MTAILALLFAFVFAPVGVVLGLVARRQISRSGESGRGLATAGVLLGGVFTVLGVVAGVFVVHAVVDAVTTVSAADVGKMIDAKVAAPDVAVAPASCPEDLKLQAGRSVRCEVTVDEQPVDVIVTVTSMDGLKPRYDLDTQARPVPRPVLERKVGELVGEMTQIVPTATSCATDLEPSIGRRVFCTVTSATGPAEWSVTTSGVDGGLVRFVVQPK